MCVKWCLKAVRASLAVAYGLPKNVLISFGSQSGALSFGIGIVVSAETASFAVLIVLCLCWTFARSLLAILASFWKR